MNRFNLTGLLACLLLVAAGTVMAQSSTSNPSSSQRAVRLSVVALDSAGNPVPDLKASDLTVFDKGAPQRIVSLRLNQGNKPAPVVILFDLLNADETSRGVAWNAIKTRLTHLQSTGPLYLYLLVADGSLYAVHALPATPAGQAAADSAVDSSWIKDAGPLMDAAMQKAVELKPLDFRAISPIGLQERFKATYRALDDIRVRMAAWRGPKELLWITYGIPSAIQFADRTWFDGVPFLRQLGARFARSQTTVYTADSNTSLARGILNRDSLEVLAGSTSGRAFSTIDIDRAIAQMGADSRANYSVEYQPPANNWDGKYHKVRVSVVRKGVRLQSEPGYYAVSGT
jgi:VWFA-related protein